MPGFTVTARDASGQTATASGTITTTTGSTANLPNLLNGYAARPPWQVAGVDFYVGVPNGTVLKNPLTISMTGVSINSSTHIVTVSGNNVTLDGYDFSLNGGWEVYVTGANAVITNSNFAVGANRLIPVIGANPVTNLSLTHCKLDGTGGNTDNLVDYRSSNAAAPGLISRYNWFRNAQSDVHGCISGVHMIEYNLYQNGTYASGAHSDFIEFTNCVTDGTKIRYNTLYFTYHSGNAVNEGIQVEAQLTSTMRNVEVSNNVIIAAGSQSQLSASYLIAVRQDSGNIISGANVHDNYMDATAAYGWFYAAQVGGSNPIVSGNKNMLNGKTINANNTET